MSGMWLGVDLIMDTGKGTCLEKGRIPCSKNVKIVLSSIINMMGGAPIWSLNERENLHFDNEYDIHVSFEQYEVNGFGYELGLFNHLVLIACFISREKWM